MVRHRFLRFGLAQTFPLSVCKSEVRAFPDAAHFFTFSPSSTKRRMAVERLSSSSCLADQASTSLKVSFGRRIVTAGSRPVAGRPSFFWCTLIDLLIITVYQNSKPRGSANFRPGSNPNHEGSESNDPG
jgi:hypothetical protein